MKIDAIAIAILIAVAVGGGVAILSTSPHKANSKEPFYPRVRHFENQWDPPAEWMDPDTKCHYLILGNRLTPRLDHNGNNMCEERDQ